MSQPTSVITDYITSNRVYFSGKVFNFSTIQRSWSNKIYYFHDFFHDTSKTNRFSRSTMQWYCVGREAPRALVYFQLTPIALPERSYFQSQTGEGGSPSVVTPKRSFDSISKRSSVHFDELKISPLFFLFYTMLFIGKIAVDPSVILKSEPTNRNPE